MDAARMRRWLTLRRWGLDERARSALSRAGLKGFDDFMAGALGTPFKRKQYQEIHRLQPSPEQTWFLKRSLPQPLHELPGKVLRTLRRGELPHTESFHVHHASAALASLGFDVMRVIAWGEERLFGLVPLRGFVLTLEAPGRDASDLFEQGSSQDRRRLMIEVGRLVGRLHARGLFLTLRLHDLIVVEGANGPKLTMIDLDFKGGVVRPARWDSSASIHSLAVCCYLFLRWGHRLSAEEFKAFRTGFSREVVAAGLSIPARFFLSVRRAVDQRLSEHFRDPRCLATFPKTPQSTRTDHPPPPAVTASAVTRSLKRTTSKP
jgi:hypothetical protein